jgi:rhamnose transport system ATP-binding protein
VPVLALDGVTKTFPGVTALSEVSLELFPGKVTALVGENGAGKSTVVKILTGIYQPDGGTIESTARRALALAAGGRDAGVTAIHQETVLFDELSVAENVFLGHAPRGRFGLIDRADDAPAHGRHPAGIGADIGPETKLKDLGIANKHLVAIARALSPSTRAW